ncbi:MAG: CAP domain-containing protein [Myxococcales bacterium]|nr:CAP domain-containing protein [Myxococcales bacterium]
MRVESVSRITIVGLLVLCSIACSSSGSTSAADGGVQMSDTVSPNDGGSDTASPKDSSNSDLVSADTLGGMDTSAPNDATSGVDTAPPDSTALCARWKSDYPTTTAPNFQSAGGCDPGSISQGSIDDAIRRINLYRWLVDLPPLVEDPSLSALTQACAVLQANNDGPSNTVNPHSPPANWTCYTEDGKSGSGASNISWGVSHPADTISQYIADQGTASLGHRLWIISPGLNKTGIGLATGSGKWGVASCLYTFAGTGTTKVDFVAFPAPGLFPIQAMKPPGYNVATWSFTSSVYSVSALTSVTLVRASDGDTQSVSARKISGYGHPAGIAFNPRTPNAGETYTVKLGTIYSYEVTFVDCK